MSCLVAAAALTSLLPINKALWTPSFVLVTAGIGLALYALLGLVRSPQLAIPPGQAAPKFYFVTQLLIPFLICIVHGITIWHHDAAAVRAHRQAPPATNTRRHEQRASVPVPVYVS